ncbi:Arm DNA-binding domain-containing protein [Dolichospermum sp. ST_con]|nr:Arm DNA-binding domain-containing protein [Dolichospermum sp. ST_con]MDD1421970.1 Arm DNA-binding domain-containing protein [Dolichospermum sp. ST_sed1]MDD1427647.1 Arm DNA-binding domain-containing protein [Dolichospermum sp. ST_sed9]MDD1429945.1 Arm DNA-binding domain-containing protein [Dolichospermum sp. ST_sed6]MDD1438744.1 Arm DNA-binding domain-containing protein [Dolichospermum sp. ST_sed10]MDD1443527.1 Arm DNA-binding domain-containing protein [Dolichospermum sp. ST_sed3]MDD144594
MLYKIKYFFEREPKDTWEVAYRVKGKSEDTWKAGFKTAREAWLYREALISAGIAER